jgi:hypothetical protein
MTICKITVFALVRELQELKRYDVRSVSCASLAVDVIANDEGKWIRYSDFEAVMARNVIPEGSTP